MPEETNPSVSGVCKALAGEEKAVKFYLDAARLVRNKPARDMFRDLAREEKTHLEVLRVQYESLSLDRGWVSLPEFCDCAHVDLTSLENRWSALKARIGELSSDLEALMIAAEMESDSVLYYSGQYDSATDPVAKALYAHLADAERRHADIVLANWEYLVYVPA